MSCKLPRANKTYCHRLVVLFHRLVRRFFFICLGNSLISVFRPNFPRKQLLLTNGGAAVMIALDDEEHCRLPTADVDSGRARVG